MDQPDPLAQKLADFDLYADQAVEYLRAWLHWHRDYLIAIARGRHAEGHYRYGDKVMFEYSPETLEAEAAQELADAIVYISRRLKLEGRPPVARPDSSGF